MGQDVLASNLPEKQRERIQELLDKYGDVLTAKQEKMYKEMLAAPAKDEEEQVITEVLGLGVLSNPLDDESATGSYIWLASMKDASEKALTVLMDHKDAKGDPRFQLNQVMANVGKWAKYHELYVESRNEGLLTPSGMKQLNKQ